MRISVRAQLPSPEDRRHVICQTAMRNMSRRLLSAASTAAGSKPQWTRQSRQRLSAVGSRAWRWATALACLVCAGAVDGQQRGAAALGPLVDGLGNTMRVLVIGAHPDDEDTQLIAWLARGRQVRLLICR